MCVKTCYALELCSVCNNEFSVRNYLHSISPLSSLDNYRKRIPLCSTFSTSGLNLYTNPQSSNFQLNSCFDCCLLVNCERITH